jgi:hypothetical protein
LENREKIFWIDSVCINQADWEERGKQVLQMQDIYSPGGAIQVLVWLREEGTARLALEECSIDRFESLLHSIIKKWGDLQLKCRDEVKFLAAPLSGIVPSVTLEYLTRTVNMMKFLTTQSVDYPFSHFAEWDYKMARLRAVYIHCLCTYTTECINTINSNILGDVKGSPLFWETLHPVLVLFVLATKRHHP